jgi:hypothetical protein
MIDKCIGLFPKVFNDDFCKLVIEAFNKNEALGFAKNRLERENVNSNYKDDTSTFITELTNQSFTQELSNEFHKVLQKSLNEYANKYSVLKEGDPLFVRTIKLQKTKPGQGYHIWHYEHCSLDRDRVLAWTAYMNDDFEAGETEFLYQQYRYKPKKGDLMIFPAGFTHTHRGNPPIGGDKYIITGWIEF